MGSEPIQNQLRRDPSRTSALAPVGRVAAEFLGLGALLFVARFVARGYLAPRMDQECHIGGIAADVLAHGVRFPLMAYSPNEYDNGSFIQGLLAAIGFAVAGHNVLVLRLVTHAFVTAGAVAALHLLRRCLTELGWSSRRQRAIAVVVMVSGLALAPRLVTMLSMYGIGNHPEGTGIDLVLLALFAARLGTTSALRTAAFWASVGFALYVNKGTLLVIPVLGLAEVIVSRRAPWRLVAALGGLVFGMVPELAVLAQRHGRGWESIIGKAESGASTFPEGFVRSLATVGDHRVELLVPWGIALAFGVWLLWRSRSMTLGLVVGFSLLHLAVLTVMARMFMDFYVLYGYPTITILLALLVVAVSDRVAARAGERAGLAAGITAIVLVAVAHRPAATSWSLDRVRELFHDQAGAVCSWRFAEGFGREYDHGAAPGATSREEHVIARCRSLIDETQVADCIGGMARELAWRHQGHVEGGAPPAALDDVERRAYAYHYGTHRYGQGSDCAEFREPALQATCASAVRLECLVFGDALTRMQASRPLGRPSCELEEPPDDAFWGAMRRDFLTREPGPGPDMPESRGPDALGACSATFTACYDAS